MIKYAFIGGTMCGYKLIDTLINNNHLPLFAVILKEDDHEAERYSDKISSLLNDKGIQNSTKRKLSESDYQIIRDSALDFIIVSGWRTLIDTKVNDFTKHGVIAAHYSLLPKYRGFAPLQWAVINGEKETGVTLFMMGNGEADSGKIISQKKLSIGYDETSWELNKKIIMIANGLYLEYIDKLQTNSVNYLEQDESQATYTCKRIPEDGRIYWNKSSDVIYNLIRAVAYPYPGAFCFYNDSTFHIRKARKGESDKKIYSGIIPGRVIKIGDNGIEVLCGKGTIQITEWENKNANLITNPNSDVNSIKATLY
ncbi:MAG: methionyl-tRNA formyltransferase [bacterium]